MSWTKAMFQTDKPVIAMCHLLPLPGDPYFNKNDSMEYVVEMARKDLLALQHGGVDAVLFSNEFSLPYLTDVQTETVAAMARIIGELKPQISVPFGVNVLWDAKKSLDLAAATGAAFVREIFTGVYASDFGMWNTNVGETIRHQHHIGAEDVKLLFNIVPEAASYMGSRQLSDIAKSTVFNNHPDGLCVSGLTAGENTDPALLKQVKQTVPKTEVFANTGVNFNNLEKQLAHSDGVIVGTAFKENGIFENHVDETRVKDFMQKAKTWRETNYSAT